MNSFSNRASNTTHSHFAPSPNSHAYADSSIATNSSYRSHSTMSQQHPASPNNASSSQPSPAVRPVIPQSTSHTRLSASPHIHTPLSSPTVNLNSQTTDPRACFVGTYRRPTSWTSHLQHDPCPGPTSSTDSPIPLNRVGTVFSLPIAQNANHESWLQKFCLCIHDNPRLLQLLAISSLECPQILEVLAYGKPDFSGYTNERAIFENLQFVIDDTFQRKQTAHTQPQPSTTYSPSAHTPSQSHTHAYPSHQNQQQPPSDVPPGAYQPNAVDSESTNVSALIAQQRAFEADQRRLDREAKQAANALEAEQRRLDREAHQASMLAVVEQLLDTQFSILRSSSPKGLTQKTASQVRTNPPPAFHKGDNLIVHLRTKVESHLREYYNHSRDEQILALGLVFSSSEDRKIKSREIAEELLPPEPTKAADRLPTYRAIVDRFGEDSYMGEFTALLPSEHISDFFKRTRILVEETLTLNVEAANARTLQLMKDRKKCLIPTIFMSTLDIIILSTLPSGWKQGVSCDLIEIIVRNLEETRDNFAISSTQIGNVSCFNINRFVNDAPATESQQSSHPEYVSVNPAHISNHANHMPISEPVGLHGPQTSPSQKHFRIQRVNDFRNMLRVQKPMMRG